MFAVLAGLAGVAFMVNGIRAEAGPWQTGMGALLVVAGIYSLISNYRSLKAAGRKDATRPLANS